MSLSNTVKDLQKMHENLQHYETIKKDITETIGCAIKEAEKKRENTLKLLEEDSKLLFLHMLQSIKSEPTHTETNLPLPVHTDEINKQDHHQKKEEGNTKAAVILKNVNRHLTKEESDPKNMFSLITCSVRFELFL